jgi:CDP-diacylglycerol--glycerol-3-phosphate 3-phosphatidyltransferase
VRSRASTFGPSALATPANALTMTRLLASPLLIVLVVTTGPSTWWLATLWLISSCTDGIDGVIARKMGATRSGAFLDPLADKFLVLGVLAALAGIGQIGWLPVSLIAVREVAMSIFRSFAGRHGVSIPARPTAKLKTLVQDVVIGVALLPPVGLHHVGIVRDLLWVAVALTLFTGLEYARDGRQLLRSGGDANDGAQQPEAASSQSRAS